jgi:multidrug resistance efflux pump
MRLPLAAALIACVAAQSLAQERQEDETQSGRLEAVAATELKLDLKNYNGELRLKSVVAPGTRVKAGDVVAQVDAAEYERWLARARENAQLAEQALAAAQDATDHHQVTLPLQVQRAQRDFERATEALDFFRRKDRDNRIRNSQMNLESFEFNIQDQEEELRQLEELYRGNDLAKESQDIVLNRSKRRLKQSKERFEMQKESHKRFVELEIPRIEQDMVAAVDGARAELDRLKRMQEKGNFELVNRLVRARQGLEDARKALADLESDAGGFVLKAPHDGHVLVGGAAGNNSVQAQLRAGDRLARGQALATVVDTTRLQVTFTLPARSRAQLAVGARVNLRVGADAAGQARITAVGFVVDAKGRISATAEIANGDGALLVGTKVNVDLP